MITTRDIPPEPPKKGKGLSIFWYGVVVGPASFGLGGLFEHVLTSGWISRDTLLAGSITILMLSAVTLVLALEEARR